ncbi:hypothetical protein LHP98_11000 [Rhodobacter sp. Har01]|uniref:tetratricopeptide repeat protein n=1 Tax=Rhodobacter sp. Har01 TaxID=2883999 RepID=UPI001D080271|nr:tetratricopeptide repeat protein [Rhodobacter sp. Har01]MCB6178655.1 hypothetical protein [Rhodobacter sp. Har01]
MPLRLSLSLIALAAVLASPAAAACSDPDEGIDLNQRLADCEAELGQIWDRSGAAHLVFNQGRTLRLLGRHEEALPVLHEALRYNPERGLYWAELARLYLALGEPGTAAAMFGQAMAQEPQDPYARADRAEAWFNLGREQACIEDLDASLPQLKGMQDEAWFLNLQGRCQHAAGRQDKAMQAFDAALQVFPDYIDALGNKAFAQFAAGQYDAVLATSDGLLDAQRFPDLAPGWEISLRGLRIETQDFLGRPAAEAAAEVAALKAKFPDDLQVTNLDAWQKFLAGDLAGADTAAQPLRDSPDAQGFMLDTAAQIDLALGRSDVALDTFYKAAWIDPGVASGWVPALAAQGYLPQTRLADAVLLSLRRCVQDKGADCSLRPLPVTAPQMVTIARPADPAPVPAPEPAGPPSTTPGAPGGEGPGFDPAPAQPAGGAAADEPAPEPPALGRAPGSVRAAP